MSYDWTRDVMTYVSVARGYVTGGFPANSINNPLGKPEVPFAASTSWTYEAGFKAELLDRRLKLSGAIFFNDVKNGHLFVFNVPSASFTVATLDYQSWGGELDAAVRVAPGFELFGGVGVTSAELINVPLASATGARDGNRVPNVAPLTANLGFQYQVSAATLGLAGDFFFRGAYQFVDTRAADVANSFDLPSYGIVNGKLGWKGPTVDAYVANKPARRTLRGFWAKLWANDAVGARRAGPHRRGWCDGAILISRRGGKLHAKRRFQAARCVALSGRDAAWPGFAAGLRTDMGA